MATLIFANGILQPDRGLNWLEPYFEQADLVIAADGGSRHLASLHRRPDVVVGDLDSLPAGWRHEFEMAGVEVIVYPTSKDETDLELALLLAAERTLPESEILVFAALGGRLDQTLANLMLLAHPSLTAHSVKVVESGQEAWLVSTETTCQGAVGDVVSLIPLERDVIVAETRGLAWPLRNERLIFGRSRGVSNQLTEKTAHIRLAQGTLLCVHSRL